MRKILIAILLFISPILVIAQTTEQINPKDPNYNVELNAILQTISANTQSLSLSVANTATYFSSGILNPANGGTGQNSSAWTSGDVVYMSNTGVWGHRSFTAVPTNIQVFSTPGTATWSKPVGVTSVYVKVWGAGSGGGDSGTGGLAGGTSSFAGTTTIQATGGGITSGATPGTAGVGSNGQLNLTGQVGSGGSASSAAGGIPPMGIGTPVIAGGSTGASGFAYGGRAGANGASASGGAGGYAEGFIAVTTNVTVTVGAGGNAGGGASTTGGGGLLIISY